MKFPFLNKKTKKPLSAKKPIGKMAVSLAQRLIFAEGERGKFVLANSGLLRSKALAKRKPFKPASTVKPSGRVNPIVRPNQKPLQRLVPRQAPRK
jgi:hypothetical protein